MKARILILSLLAVSSWSQAEEKKTIYKYTDENGVTHYTETKPNDNYVEADLPELSVVPSIEVKPSQSSSSSNTEVKDPWKQISIKILSPTADENIWGTGGKVTAEIKPLTEDEQEYYLIQFILDGKKMEPSFDHKQVFDNVYRGEHTIKAALLDKTSMKTLKTSKPVTFYLHQNSKK